MGLGRELLAAAVQDDRSWSRQGFLEDVDRLRGEIHKTLFSPAPPAVEHPEPPRIDDGTIRDILTDIVAGWRSKAEEGEKSRGPLPEAAPPPSAESLDEGEESLETIIIGPAHTRTAEGPTLRRADDEPAETVIISADKQPEKAPTPRPPEEELEETVILGAGKKVPMSSPPAGGAKRDEPLRGAGRDEMEETVIISSLRAREEKLTPPKQDKGLGDQTLEETVIISRRADGSEFQTPPAPRKESAKPAEDDLEATLMITKKPPPGEKG